MCVTLGFGTDSNMLGLTLPRDDPRLIARRVDLLFLMFTPTGGVSRVVSVQHKTLKLSSKHDGIIHRSSRASHRFQKVTARKTTQLEEYRPVKIFKFVVSNFINPGMVRWEPNRSTERGCSRLAIGFPTPHWIIR